MLRRNLIPVWFGIILLSCMFLMGQDTWSPCIDFDGDGYSSHACGGADCDDTNPDIHPGVIESSYWDEMCNDYVDNDCDGYTDLDDDSCDTIVEFPDPNLEAAIREAIEKPEGDIWATELHALEELNAEARDIIDLAGIEYCTNLNVLDIGRNYGLSDISLVSGLTNLSILAVDRCQISDITALEGLTNLTRLFLLYNIIEDISPLSGLTDLTLLQLSHNAISDASPISSLINLTELRMEVNFISDITPLGELTNLMTLTLYGNSAISDLTPLTELTNLRVLGLGRNNISDILPLVENIGIDSGDLVKLDENPLSETSCTVYIPELESRGVTVHHQCP